MIKLISTTDRIVVLCYVLALVIIGLWAGTHKKKTTAGAPKDYFLAGKTLRWPMIGLSLFATNISCLHLVSLAQSGFDTGLLNGNFEWMAAFTLILLAVFFIGFYMRTGVTTLPDFLEKRYNRACRDWLAVISMLSAIIIHIAFSFLAGGIVLETLFGINMFTSIIIISLLTALYTIIGGLKAVVVTESIQVVVLIAGAMTITFFAYQKIGGWDPMVSVLHAYGEMNKLSMLRPVGDKSNLSWVAVFLGYPVLGIWYWCADQTIVQRVLGAKDENHARVGALFCGFIKILPVFIFVLPGLFAYTLYRKGLLDVHTLQQVNAHGETIINTKGIYTVMITQLLPTGLVGLAVAALLSGLMSQISGALNSISTLFTYDLYQRFNPQQENKKLVRIGRYAAAGALVISLAILPLLNRYESLFEGINDVIAHIAPPITCVFLLGVFWKRASALSAQLTLWLGSALGVFVYFVRIGFPDSLVGQTGFMMVAFCLFCSCVIMQVAFTMMLKAKKATSNEKLFWQTVYPAVPQKVWTGLGNYKRLSVLLMITIGILYWLFR